MACDSISSLYVYSGGGWLDYCYCLCVFGPAAHTAPRWTLGFLIGQVQERLNAAADVHEPEGYVMDITFKHIWGEIGLKWEERYWREVVEDYDG